MDPEDLSEITGGYHRCVAETVRRHNGLVAHAYGNTAVVYFGYPQAHEDDPERAVRAALELVAAVAALRNRAPLQTRVGIATGLVVVGEITEAGGAQQRGIIGETPSLAARLQAIAEPDTVVVAQSTRKLLGNLFELEDLGTKGLKGIPAPGRAWVALRPSSEASRFEALHGTGLTALVGREEELELLKRRWSRAKAGEGQVVLLSGEAGIGKSRLTAALLEAIARPSRTRDCAISARRSTPTAPFIPPSAKSSGPLDLPAMTAYEQSSTNSMHCSRKAQRRPRTPRSSLRCCRWRTTDAIRALELTPQQRRLKTLEALFAQVDELSQLNPVLMIFEDAQWIDPTSLELFSRIVDRIPTLRVLLIVTFRPEFRAAVDRTALRHRPHHQSADGARSRRHDRPRRRQQVAAGDHSARHHRANRRHSAVRGGNDQGGVGSGERKRRSADRRGCSLLGIGSPSKLACVADGTA